MFNLTQKKIIIASFIVIMAIAIFFRFYHLSQTPPGLYPDVAINGNDALDALQNNDFRIFYPENNGREGLFMNLIALSFRFFGVSVWAIKVVPAIIGFLTILGFYLMVNELFERLKSKSQTTNNKQISNTNDQNTKPSVSDLKNCHPAGGHPKGENLFEAWNLGFGISTGTLIALLSTFFLSVSFWHVNFSRLGFRAILVPFFLVWGFFFLFRAIGMTKKIGNCRPAGGRPQGEKLEIRNFLCVGYWLLAGLVFGLGFQSYISYRVLPAILGIIFLIEAYNIYKTSKPERHTLKFILLWLLLAIAIIAAVSPMIVYFYHHPQDFMGRTGQVSVLASKTPLKDLSLNFAKTLGMFNVQGDCNWRHNYNCQPELPAPVGILFLIGFIFSFYYFFKGAISLFRRQKSNPKDNDQQGNWSLPQISFFLLTWFFVMLLPEILSNEGLPHSLRAIGVIPVVYLFAGLAGVLIIKRFVMNFKKTTIILALAFCLWLVLYSYDNYFIQWGQSDTTRGAFTQHLVDIGNYLNNLPENAKKYVIVNEGGVAVPYPDGIPMPAQTIQFIEQTSPAKNKAFYLKPDQISWFHGLGPAAKYPVIFTLLDFDQQILNQLQQADPNGHIKQEANNIWTFIINPNDKTQMTNQ